MNQMDVKHLNELDFLIFGFITTQLLVEITVFAPEMNTVSYFLQL